MNQREKILAGCLAIAIGGGLGVTGVKTMVIEPRRELAREIAAQRARQDRLEVQLNGADKIIQGWQARTRQTLDVDPFAADQIFRKNVDELLKRNKLMSEKSSVGQAQPYVYKKGVRQGFTELSLSVTAMGTLGDVVTFLKDFYQLPYLVRVDKLSLSAHRTSKARASVRRRGAAASSEPELTVMLTLTTLVLPKVDDVEHPTVDLAGLEDPESDTEFASLHRLREEDPDTYGEIADVNIFKPWEPPQVVKNEPRQVVKVPDRPSPPPPPPPPAPRLGADKYVVTGVAETPEGPVAYVINADDTLAPPTEYYLNDEIDDGKLVLIVPQGVVVRVLPEEKRGGASLAKNYFYALGSNFKEREEVNPTDHPEVARLLRQVLKPETSS